MARALSSSFSEKLASTLQCSAWNIEAITKRVFPFLRASLTIGWSAFTWERERSKIEVGAVVGCENMIEGSSDQFCHIVTAQAVKCIHKKVWTDPDSHGMQNFKEVCLDVSDLPEICGD